MLLDLNGHALRISSAPIPACILAACTKLVTAIVGGIMVSEIGYFLLPQRPNIGQGPEGDTSRVAGPFRKSWNEIRKE
jgi:hypothetical protein